MKEGTIVADMRKAVLPRVFDGHWIGQYVSIDGKKLKVVGKLHEQHTYYVYFNHVSDIRRTA